MKKLLLNILGCLLVIIGSIFIISYLNMIDIGYKINEYIHFIIRRYECLIAFLGIIILVFNNLGGNK